MNAERHLKPPRANGPPFRDAPEAIEETQHLLSPSNFRWTSCATNIPTSRCRRVWTRRPGSPNSPGDPLPCAIPTECRRSAEAPGGRARPHRQARLRPLFPHDPRHRALRRGARHPLPGARLRANSAVCYVLGITAVDPAAHDLLFARFISEERREPPDIDVDFEPERREEDDPAHLSQVRHPPRRHRRDRDQLPAKERDPDVGKALGLTEDVTGRLAGTQWEAGAATSRTHMSGRPGSIPQTR